MNAVAWLLYWPLATRAAARASGFETWSLMRHVVRGVAGFGLPVGLAAASARLLPLSDLMTVACGIALATLVALVIAAAVRPVRADLRAVIDVLVLALRRKPRRAAGHPDEATTHDLNH